MGTYCTAAFASEAKVFFGRGSIVQSFAEANDVLMESFREGNSRFQEYISTARLKLNQIYRR